MYFLVGTRTLGGRCDHYPHSTDVDTEVRPGFGNQPQGTQPGARNARIGISIVHL